MKKNISITPAHVGISVPDAEAAIAWYEQVLGFVPVSDRYQPALRARVVFLERGDFRIELFQHDQFVPLPEERREPNRDIMTCGTKHLCFYTDDMDGLYAWLAEQGVDFATPIFAFGANRVLFIRDCAGNLLEFIQQGASGAEGGTT